MIGFRKLFVALALIAGVQAAQGAVVTEEIDYLAGETRLKGFIAYDDAIKGKRPGVLVVHEWWGHNAYTRSRAEMLAGMGYTALAVDMYGDGKTADHPADAGKFAAEVRKNLPVMQQRFEAGLAALNRHPTVDETKNAAIGYCFGGGVVLEMARQGLDIDAVASFHGSLAASSKAEKGKVKARVMVANGADDKMVSPQEIDALRAEMEAAGVDFRLFNYPGAQHAFTNPAANDLGARFNLPVAYNPEADQASWAELDKFLRESFK